MSKLVFPNVGKPYRGEIERYRNYMQEMASHVERSPALKTVLRAQLQPLLDKLA